MARLPRPYIPLKVRVEVAARQYEKKHGIAPGLAGFSSDRERLAYILFGLLNPFDGQLHLDHDPALQNRQFNKRTGKYTPDANDPEYLIYRTADDHKIKTLVRGDGAQRSDAAQRRYLKRVDQNRGKRPKKATRKIAQPKNFKWPKRKFQTSRSVK